MESLKLNSKCILVSQTPLTAIYSIYSDKLDKELKNKRISKTKMSLTSRTQKIKIVFLGDQNVGKTCLLNRFMHDTFDESHIVRQELTLSQQWAWTSP